MQDVDASGSLFQNTLGYGHQIPDLASDLAPPSRSLRVQVDAIKKIYSINLDRFVTERLFKGEDSPTWKTYILAVFWSIIVHGVALSTNYQQHNLARSQHDTLTYW